MPFCCIISTISGGNSTQPAVLAKDKVVASNSSDSGANSTTPTRVRVTDTCDTLDSALTSTTNPSSDSRISATLAASPGSQLVSGSTTCRPLATTTSPNSEPPTSPLPQRSQTPMKRANSKVCSQVNSTMKPMRPAMLPPSSAVSPLETAPISVSSSAGCHQTYW